MIIKQATQSELSTGLRQRFLDPLGFSHTFFAGEEDISGEMAHGWYDIDQDGILDDFSDIPRIAIDSLGWGAGGLVASAEDLAQWASHLFYGEVLASKSLEEMVNFISLSSSPSTTGYGLGTYRFNFFGRTLWGHTGGDVDFCSVVLFLPEDGGTFVVLINQVEPSVANIASELLNTYLNWRQN
jgi:CubicO group peptidase (beta-lactamase class C family)